MGSKCFSGELLLTNPTGSRLYHSYGERLPIVDYHCHLEAREICENREFKDLGEMWLAHDHYKWRAMRTFGISEEYITLGLMRNTSPERQITMTNTLPLPPYSQ